MSRHALFSLCALATAVLAQPDPSVSTALVDKHFSYPAAIPYQVDPANGVRGPQQGYNLCNASTENQNSKCQTAFVNAIDDFCLWAPMNPNSLIADTEGEEVAWCTKPGRGTRLIPSGALQGVQFTRTPDYVQVVGFIDQTLINIQNGDSGGELDPHGADLRGNPLGGLMYSNAFPSNNGNNNSFQQASEWHNFMGGNVFCIKACDPARPNAADFCQHIYDRIGCAYNAPSALYQRPPGTFEACTGDVQDYPGVYTAANGQVATYTQPPEAAGAISSLPYEPRVPPSSGCVAFASQALYTGQPSGTSVSASATGSATGSVSAIGAATRTGTGSGKIVPTAAGDRAANGAGAPLSFTSVYMTLALAGTLFAAALFH